MVVADVIVIYCVSKERAFKAFTVAFVIRICALERSRYYLKIYKSS